MTTNAQNRTFFFSPFFLKDEVIWKRLCFKRCVELINVLFALCDLRSAKAVHSGSDGDSQGTALQLAKAPLS